jgi:hypothetical protein
LAAVLWGGQFWRQLPLRRLYANSNRPLGSGSARPSSFADSIH